MARVKKTPVIREAKRKPGYFVIVIGNKKISNLTTDEFLEKYFVNLDKNLKEDTDLEKLIKQYELVWSKKGKIYYIDSWGHTWEQGASKTKMIDYLCKFQKALKSEDNNSK